MKTRLTIFSVILICSCNIFASDYINIKAKEIASSSPAIAAYVNSGKAQIAELKAENVLDNPEVSFSHLWGQKNIGNKYTIGISQSFDWPGVYSARSKVVTARQKALSDYMLVKTADIFFEAKQAMIDVVYAKRLIALRSEVFRQVDSLYFAYKKARLTGDVTLLDLNKAAIERGNASRYLREAEMMLASAVNKLKGVNGSYDVNAVIGELQEYPQISIRSQEEYFRYIIDLNPQILAAKSEVEIAQLQESLTKAMRLPRFSVGYEHEYEMGERFNGLSVSMTLPIYSSKNSSQASYYTRLAADHDLVNSESILKAECETLRNKVLIAQSEVEHYGAMFIGFENFNMLQRLFRAGQINLMEYITELTYFIDAQVEYELYLRDMHLDAANLNKFFDLCD